MSKKINNKFSLRVPDGLAKDIAKYIKDYNYSGPAELFRESIREKIYGKTRNEEIENKGKRENLDEDKYFFEENKKLYLKLKEIERKL